MKSNTGYVNQIYGVTRDPLTHEYAIVTAFKNGGNLRRVILENHTDLTWLKVINMIYYISDGLSNIHQSNYHHKDFHSGNILNRIDIYNNYIGSVISDFGMSRPADEKNEKTLYGVMPLVAPDL